MKCQRINKVVFKANNSAKKWFRHMNNKFTKLGLEQLLHENIHVHYFVSRVESEMANDAQTNWHLSIKGTHTVSKKLR